ncbi:MAG: hypothetical protein EBU93_07165, partial [Chlamydiae bacterium]|nr:hypothetical protein [Chlamydiota bacterium]
MYFSLSLVLLLLLVEIQRTHSKNRLYFSNRFPYRKGGGDDLVMRPAGPILWTNCGDPATDLFQLESIVVSPDPPRRSAPLTVNIRGYLKETLDEGRIDYVAKFGGFTLASGNLDGCPTLHQEPDLPQCP